MSSVYQMNILKIKNLARIFPFLIPGKFVKMTPRLIQMRIIILKMIAKIKQLVFKTKSKNKTESDLENIERN